MTKNTVPALDNRDGILYNLSGVKSMKSVKGGNYGRW